MRRCRRSRPPRPAGRGSAARSPRVSTSTLPSRSTRVAPSASAVGLPAASAPVVRSCPERAGVLLVGVERRDAQLGDGDGAFGDLQRGAARLGCRGGALAVVDDDRERGARRVVVLGLDQRGDVEQVTVEPVRREQAERLGRHDVQVPARPGDRRLRDRPVRARLDDDRLLPVAPVETSTTSPVTNVTLLTVGGPSGVWCLARRPPPPKPPGVRASRRR